MNFGNPSSAPTTAGDILRAITGAATLAAGCMLFGDGDNTLATLAAPSSTGQILTGTTTAPVWSGTGLTWSSNVLTIAGSAPGTPSAGQVLIGGGQIHSAGTIRAASGFVALGGILSRPAADHVSVVESGGAGYIDGFQQSSGDLLLPLNFRCGAANFSAGITCTTLTASGTISALASHGTYVQNGASWSHQIVLSSTYDSLLGGPTDRVTLAVPTAAAIDTSLTINAFGAIRLTGAGATLLSVTSAGALTTSAGITCTTLTASADTDVSLLSGRFAAYSAFSDVMMIAHVDRANGTDFALLQRADGTTDFNSTGLLALKVGGAQILGLTSTAPGTPSAGQVLIGGGNIAAGATIDASGYIVSSNFIGVKKAGSDSAVSGPFWWLSDAVTPTNAWSGQMSASGHFDLWSYSSSAWVRQLRITNTGSASFAGKITANSAAASSTMTGATLPDLITWLQSIIA